MPGKGLSSLILSKAPAKSPCAIKPMNSLTLMCNGHASTQVGFLHCKHRSASTLTCSSENPSATSAGPRRRTSGGRSGRGWRGALGFGFILGLTSGAWVTVCFVVSAFKITLLQSLSDFTVGSVLQRIQSRRVENHAMAQIIVGVNEQFIGQRIV